MEADEILETVLEVFAAGSQMVLVDAASREPWIGYIVAFKTGVLECNVRPLRTPDVAIRRRKWKLAQVADVAAIEDAPEVVREESGMPQMDWDLMDWAALRREAARVATVAEEQIVLQRGRITPATGTYIIGATEDGSEILYSVESQSIQTGKKVGSGSKPAGSVTDRAIAGLSAGGSTGGDGNPDAPRWGPAAGAGDAQRAWIQRGIDRALRNAAERSERSAATRARGRSTRARHPGS